MRVGSPRRKTGELFPLVRDAKSSFRFLYAENRYGRFADRWNGLRKLSQNSGNTKHRSTIWRRCVERHPHPNPCMLGHRR